MSILWPQEPSGANSTQTEGVCALCQVFLATVSCTHTYRGYSRNGHRMEPMSSKAAAFFLFGRRGAQYSPPTWQHFGGVPCCCYLGGSLCSKQHLLPALVRVATVHVKGFTIAPNSTVAEYRNEMNLHLPATKRANSMNSRHVWHSCHSRK